MTFLPAAYASCLSAMPERICHAGHTPAGGKRCDWATVRQFSKVRKADKVLTMSLQKELTEARYSPELSSVSRVLGD